SHRWLPPRLTLARPPDWRSSANSSILKGSAPALGAGFFVSCSARTDAGPQCPQEGEKVKDYEVVYIFDSAIEEPKIEEKIERYHQLVAGENGGEVAAVDHWGRRELAYPIKDKDNGYYVVTHLSTPA